MKELERKYEELKKFIAEKGKDGVIVAFSGGLDSTTLAEICYEILGEKAIAVTLDSEIYPSQEIKEAKRLARKIGIKHYVLRINHFSDKKFVRNSVERCYFCKRASLVLLQKFARKIGFKVIFEGTNFSELKGHRPGFKAVKEMENVFSPWVECKFKKDEIRILAKKLRLPVYNKPSMACLSSRIPFGDKITKEKLKKIEKAENIVRKLTKAKQVRARMHGNLIRIEVSKEERKLFFNLKVVEKLVRNLKILGFDYITLDLEGYRTGSMLKTVKVR
ncbi:MAG: ATP-dependent sacrificial sulfur transferase LarE [Candidatus Aenigmatarchaeota archaeon]